MSYLDEWERAEMRWDTYHVFWMIWRKLDRARKLRCPRCGKKGKLMQKTTVSKKKYRYKKWYVYHERFPIPTKTSFRIQTWCYLNKNQLKNDSIQDKLKTIKRARDIERCSFECIRLRDEKFEL